MIFEKEIAGKKITVEIGKFAEQAAGAVLITYGETTVLVTAVRSLKPRGGIDYFPLSVDYDEKLYAAGRIKGSRWVKREGRPTDEAILSGRLIDRAIRPLFPDGFKNEVQIVSTILSFDSQNDADIISLVGASIALLISDIPFGGPVSSVRIGKKDNQFIINPSYEERENSSFDLVIAGFGEVINMIEAGFNETPESEVIEAVKFGQPFLEVLNSFQKEIAKHFKKEKLPFTDQQSKPDFENEIKSYLGSQLEESLFEKNKIKQASKLEDLKQSLFSYLKNKFDDPDISLAKDVFENELKRVFQENILLKEKRPDGRDLDELREITCEVGLFPRTHGSGLFKRGNTQVLSVLTLGSPGLEQYLDTIEEADGRKRFMLHYNFPKFSSGETGRIGSPGRREIGHGALAEKALANLIPDKKDFPYTIRVVSEVLSSNGSTSMASLCSASLAFYDAGVKLKEPAAGIAMGIVANSLDNYKILTDIQGPEDHFGDMDLKVGGTSRGLTIIQLDVKIKGINLKILKEALDQAKKARLEILAKMLSVIKEPRPEFSPYAPKIYTLKINPDKIGAVIGPKGKVINEIIAKTNATIDIEDDGLIFITSQSKESADKAIDWIKNITREVKIGEVFPGKVKKIVDFGIFVELMPETEGLVHISEISNERITDINKIVKIGDIISVKVKNIDDLNRVSLTMRNLNQP